MTSQIAPVLTHRSKGTVSRKDCGLSTCILANSSLAFFCVFFFLCLFFQEWNPPGSSLQEDFEEWCDQKLKYLFYNFPLAAMPKEVAYSSMDLKLIGY